MEIETSFPTKVEQDVAWGEQDKLGHVNNVTYFRYFENARIAHFQALELELPEPGQPGCGPILASTHCDFLRPLTYPDHIRTEIGVSKLGNSSFVHSYRIFSEQQQTWVARGQSVTVYYDYSTQKSTPLPPAIREAILKLEDCKKAKR